MAKIFDSPLLPKDFCHLFQQWVEETCPSAMHPMISWQSQQFFSLMDSDLWKSLWDTPWNYEQGLQKFLQDCEPFIFSRPEGFVVGENLACTPGSVIQRHPLYELIAYHPTRPRVRQRPLLIVPPWINKYYVLDLQRHNSLVSWLVRQGHSVFMLSWAHPGDKSMEHVGIEDYVQAITGAISCLQRQGLGDKVNAAGYCLGGNVLSLCALRYPHLFSSCTYLSTAFHHQGLKNLSLWLQPPFFQGLRSWTQPKGYMDGRWVASAFQWLRSKDMVWKPGIRRYFQGKETPKIDFLYWNSDYVHIPQKAFFDVVTKFFQSSPLTSGQGLEIQGQWCHWRENTIDSFIVAAEHDHIVHWSSSYAGVEANESHTQFVLCEGGHVAGIINPPEGKKYSYIPWSDKGKQTQRPGSWWTYWARWLAARSGAWQGPKELPCLGPAPGTYVKNPVENYSATS